MPARWRKDAAGGWFAVEKISVCSFLKPTRRINESLNDPRNNHAPSLRRIIIRKPWKASKRRGCEQQPRHRFLAVYLPILNWIKPGDILGFRGGEHGDDSLLECCAVQFG
jgi:hypothetical protein